MQDELGQLLFNLGRYREAIDPLQEALPAADPEHRKTLLFYLGVCHYKIGQLDAAERELLQCLPDDPRDGWWVEAQYHLGCVYFGKRAYLEAKKAFETYVLLLNESNLEMKNNAEVWLAAIRKALGSPSEQPQ